MEIFPDNSKFPKAYSEVVHKYLYFCKRESKCGYLYLIYYCFLQFDVNIYVVFLGQVKI